MARKSGLSFYRRKKRINSRQVKEVFSWIFVALLAVFIAAVLNYFMGMSTYVVGDSMEPTLYSSQRIFVDRVSYTMSKPKSGDVVVFLPNGNKNAHYYVKRVVAVPGDRVLIDGGMLFVNGEESDLIPAPISDAGIADHELTLGKGEYFCIGDNPGSSEDSRSSGIGPVEAEDIVGKVWFALAGEEGSTGFVK